MKAMGVGWLIQNAFYFAVRRFSASAAPRPRDLPPIVSALRLGVPVGGGTDAQG